LAHDYRFMKVDRSVLYMSELDHGMKLPRSLMAVVLSKLLPGALRDVVLGARKFSAQTALEGGIVDSVYPDSVQTLEAAVSEAQKLASWGWMKEVYSELRLGAFPGVLEELDAHRDPYLFPVSAKL
jgi:very-long-chain (3R)-3-hydroxyacyl-CoA dehydratase